MKNFERVSLRLLGCLPLCLLPSRIQVQAEGNGEKTEGALVNEDVNCSGSVDISDAVRILNWLLIGGDAPCPLEDPPDLIVQIARREAWVVAD